MITPDPQSVVETAGFLKVWVQPALLGIGLASATGLRTFLPLLMLAAAARLDAFGVQLAPSMDWLVSWQAIGALACASALEFAGDKIPAVDHGLNALGYVTRPIAGAVAAGSVFWALDPTAAAIAGLAVGAPAALAVNAAQTGIRVGSTAATAGLANPLVSLIEDVLAFFAAALALAAPLLVPVGLMLLLPAGLRFRRRIQRLRAGPAT